MAPRQRGQPPSVQGRETWVPRFDPLRCPCVQREELIEKKKVSSQKLLKGQPTKDYRRCVIKISVPHIAKPYEAQGNCLKQTWGDRPMASMR